MSGDTMKKSCPNCGGKTTKTTAPATVKVGSHTFSSPLPAIKCPRCDEHFFAAADLERLELLAASAFVRAGESSGEVLRFMRKALNLRAAELAELLDVTPETMSRWETGKQSLDRRAMAVVGALVVERVSGRSDLVMHLQALRNPRKLARKIALTLEPA